MRFLPEIVQRRNSHHRISQRRRNLWLAHIREMRFATNVQLVNLRRKRAPHRPNGAIKFDNRSSCGSIDARKSLRTKPALYRCNVFIRRAKLCPILFRRHPLMKIRRARVHLLAHQLIQRCLLFRAAIQQQIDPVHRLRVGNRALIELRSRQRVHDSVHRHAP